MKRLYLECFLWSFVALFRSFSSAAPASSDKALKMTVIHTNDIHAHLSPFNKMGNKCAQKDLASKTCFGGIARLKTVIDSVRREKENVYLFDAGDQFQGTMFYSYYKGNVTATYMNELAYDAMTIGNHEVNSICPL
jgi:5'-nucleotidase